MAESPSLELNRSQLATLLGVSVPTIKEAIDAGAAGVISRGGRGQGAKIDGPKFVQWWIERERNRVGDQKRDIDSLAQREQMLDIELKEDKLRRSRGEVLDRSAAIHVVCEVLNTCAAALRGAPRRFAYRLVGLPDIFAAVETLEKIAEEQCAMLRLPDNWKGERMLGAKREESDEGTAAKVG